MDQEIAVVDALIRDGHLDRGRRDEVVDALARAAPTRAQWAELLHLAGLGLGAASILAGIVYLVAFNWDALGIISRLGLVFAALVGCTAGSIAAGPRSFGGQLFATGAAVLVGSALVVYSQVYQSGADPWTLFAAWSALALPFVLGVRTPTLWALELVLLNVTLGAWLEADEDVWFAVLTGVAVVHLGLGELFRDTWLQQALRVYGVGALTWIGCWCVLDSEPEGVPALVATVVGGLGVQGLYLADRAGASAATLGYVGLVAVAFTALFEWLVPSLFSAGPDAALLLGFLLALATAAGFAWLVGVPWLRREFFPPVEAE